MSSEQVNYEAIIADIEGKIAHLQATLAGVKAVAAMNGLGINPGPTPPSGGGVTNSGHIASDAFFGKSIPEATVTILQGARRKMSTQALIDAMVKGGLPPSKYNTVYAILRRRESQVGDIVNMQGEWGLAAWYPNHVKKANTKKGAVSADTSADDGIDPDAEHDADPEEPMNEKPAMSA
jgi:hypothetical protein